MYFRKLKHLTSMSPSSSFTGKEYGCHGCNNSNDGKPRP